MRDLLWAIRKLAASLREDPTDLQGQQIHYAEVLPAHRELARKKVCDMFSLDERLALLEVLEDCTPARR